MGLLNFFFGQSLIEFRGSFLWIKKIFSEQFAYTSWLWVPAKAAQSLSKGEASPRHLTSTSSWLVRATKALCCSWAGCWQRVGSSGLGSNAACSDTALLKKTQKVQGTWSSVIMSINQLHATTYSSFKRINTGQIPSKRTKIRLQQL